LTSRNRQLSRGTPKANDASKPTTPKKKNPDAPLAELPDPAPDTAVNTGSGRPPSPPATGARCPPRNAWPARDPTPLASDCVPPPGQLRYGTSDTNCSPATAAANALDAPSEPATGTSAPRETTGTSTATNFGVRDGASLATPGRRPDGFDGGSVAVGAGTATTAVGARVVGVTVDVEVVGVAVVAVGVDVVGVEVVGADVAVVVGDVAVGADVVGVEVVGAGDAVVGAAAVAVGVDVVAVGVDVVAVEVVGGDVAVVGGDVAVGVGDVAVGADVAVVGADVAGAVSATADGAGDPVIDCLVVGSSGAAAVVGVGMSDDGSGVAAVASGAVVPATPRWAWLPTWPTARTVVAGAPATARAPAGASSAEHDANADAAIVVATHASQLFRCVST